MTRHAVSWRLSRDRSGTAVRPVFVLTSRDAQVRIPLAQVRTVRLAALHRWAQGQGPGRARDGA
jgi:hypothetical protein